jgi:transposase
MKSYKDMTGGLILQGSKILEGQLFYQISLNQLVPSDHLVRRLAEVLDLSWIRKATTSAYSHTGRPSIDPVVIAKMMLLGFLYNVPSERQLAREIQVNLAYRWYLGYDLDESVPNHSVLSKARRRLGVEFFERLFGYVLTRCNKEGLISGENLLIDSTIVQADASLDSISSLRYRPAEYFEQLEQTAEPDKESRIDPGDKLGHRRSRKDRVSDDRRSLTDPDATLYKRKGQGTKLAYKAHIAADSYKGVITSVSVSSSAQDDTSAVPQLLSQHCDLLNKPKRVVADGTYGSEDCLGYLQYRGIDTVIKQRSGGNKHGCFDKSKFSYNVDEDYYICPAGQRLKRRRTHKTQNKAYYSCDKAICRDCLVRSECIGSSSSDVVRTVTRYDSPYSDRAKALCNSRLGNRLLVLRQTCSEGLFGQAKSFHGLARARWRRLLNMHIQTLLTATVLNLKKLVGSTSKKASASAIADRFISNLRFCLYSSFCYVLKRCKGDPTTKHNLKAGIMLL